MALTDEQIFARVDALRTSLVQTIMREARIYGDPSIVAVMALTQALAGVMLWTQDRLENPHERTSLDVLDAQIDAVVEDLRNHVRRTFKARHFGGE